MAKRGAEKQITKDGEARRRDDRDDDDEVDPGTRTQSLAPVEGRQVRGLPKRKGLGTGLPSAPTPASNAPKPAFAGFSFGGPAPSAAPSTGASSTPAAKSPFAGFSFGSTPAASSSSPFGSSSTAPPAPSAPASNPFAGLSFGSASGGATPSFGAGSSFNSAAAPSPPTSAKTPFTFGSTTAPAIPVTSAPAPPTSQPSAFAESLNSSASSSTAQTSAQPASLAANSNGQSSSAASSAPMASTVANGARNEIALSQAEPPGEAEVTYWTSVRGLNQSILSFITTLIRDDPFVDLAPALPQLEEQYARHLGESARKAGWKPEQDPASIAPAANGSVNGTGGVGVNSTSSMPIPPAAPTWTLPKPSSSAAPVSGGFVPNLAESSGSSSPFKLGGASAVKKKEAGAKPLATMPAPPTNATWTLPKPSANSTPVAGGFVPDLAQVKSASSPFTFGPKPTAAKAADPKPTGTASSAPSKASSSSANQIVKDILAEPEAKSDPPAGNPFSFSLSTPAPAATPEKKSLFAFAPSGAIHPPTPDSKTFSPSKMLEDPSPAKLGKFGPGGSQPQLSFGGAKPTPQSSTPSKPSFAFGAATPSATSSGATFAFGSTTPTSAPTFTFGAASSAGSSKPAETKPAPFSFGSSLNAAAPAFSFKPFSASTSMEATPSSTSVTSAAEGEESAEPSEPSVNLAGASGAGEEGEETVFEQRGKLHRFVDGAWKVEGLGQLKLKKAKEGGKRRLLMRTDGAGNVVLNMGLSSSFNATNTGGQVNFLGFGQDGSTANYLLRVKTADMAKDLVDKLQEEVEEIKKG